MELAGLAIFAAALFFAAATPGPGIAALVARVLGRGADGAIAFTAGLAFGDVVWLSLALFGMASLAQHYAGLFLVVKYAGAAYLLYLGWRMWTAPVATREIVAASDRERPHKLFLAGLAVTLGNPKVIAFYVALVPTILDTRRVTALGYAELVGVTLVVLAIVFGFYIALAARARRLFTSPRSLRLINRGGGAMLAGAAAAVAAR